MKKILNALKKKGSRKDGKLLLCYITVIITCVTIFASINALPILEESLRQDLRQTTVGEAKYVVTHEKNGLFKEQEISNIDSLGILALDGKISATIKKRINIWALDYAKFLEVFGNTYKEQGTVEFPGDLKKNQCILSDKVAKRLGVTEGDTINVLMYGKQVSLSILLPPKDNIFAKSNEDLAICNYDDIRETLHLEKGDVTLVYLYNAGQDVTKSSIEAKYLDATIKSAIDETYIQENMSTYYGIDFMIFVFIFLISFDILKSAGVIFVTEHNKFIGNLRSNGAEKGFILKLFTKYSMKIAVLGSTIGVVVGCVLLFIYGNVATGGKSILEIYNLWSFLLIIIVVVGMMVAITCFSFRKPVSKLLMKSDRSLMLEDASADIHHTKTKKLSFVYVAFLLLAIPVPYLWKSNDMIFSIIYPVLLGFLLIKGIKIIFTFFTNLVQSKVRKGVINIAAKNVCTNVYLRKALAMSTTISLFVTIVGVLIFSVLNAMTSFYRDYKVDAYVRVLDDKPFSEQEISQILELGQVRDSFEYSMDYVTIVGKDETRKVKVVGLNDIAQYDSKVMNLHLKWLKDYDSNQFSNGNNVILSQVLCNRFGVKMGDYVTLDDGNIKMKYKIVAVTSSLQELGDAIYISKCSKEFCKGFETNGIYLFANDISELEANVDDLLGEREYVFKDVSDLKENDVTNGMQVILFFVVFAVIISFTSLAGIFSNYKLSYMKRKKEFAVLSSCGYSRKSILQVVVCEIINSSLLAYTSGIAILFVLKKPIENLMKLVELPIELKINHYVFLALLMIILITALLNCILTFSLCKVGKGKLIEELKL